MDKDRFDESLQSLAARRRAAEGHPSPDILVAYRAGDLTAEQDERIKDHLAICRECSQLVLDLAEFEEFEPSRETIAPVDVQAEEAWQRLRPKLAAEGGLAGARPVEPQEHVEETDPAPVLRSRPPVPFWRRPALPWALAAVLALCVVGLAQRPEVPPQQAEFLDLEALRAVEEDTTRGGGLGEVAVPTITGATACELPLPSDRPDFAAYDVEVVAAAGGGAPIPIGRRSAELGSLIVRLPRHLLPAGAGEYQFQVYGVDGSQRKLIATFPFQVAAQP